MGKKDIVKYKIDEYSVTSSTDITNALKDLLSETLQDVLNSKFDEHMGYDKYDQKTDKTNLKCTSIIWINKLWRCTSLYVSAFLVLKLFYW